MRRLFALGLLIISVSMSMGCATCCSPYDYAYACYGGAWQRDDLCHGRVASAYTPAGTRVLNTKVPSAESETKEPGSLPEPEAAPETKPDNMTTETRPLKSIKRARPVNSPRAYLPVND